MEAKRIDDEVKNDVVKTYYDNGELKSRANYKNGERDGQYEIWYSNGQIWTSANYKDGNLDGLCETWYENGQQWVRVNYKDGVKQ